MGASKAVVDRIAETASEIALNYAEGHLEIHIDEHGMADDVERSSISIEEAIQQAFISQAISIGHDFAFGKIQRDGRLFVKRDVIKQALGAALGEIFADHSE
jgi:hypothetical protein